MKACGTTPGVFKVDRNAWVVPQKAGQTYTLRFTRVSGGLAADYGNPYPNGCSDAGPLCPGTGTHGPQL